MMSGRYARLPISPEYLHEILDLPADVTIVGMTIDGIAPDPWQPIVLYLEGDRFPKVRERAIPPIVTPTLVVKGGRR